MGKKPLASSLSEAFHSFLFLRLPLPLNKQNPPTPLLLGSISKLPEPTIRTLRIKRLRPRERSPPGGGISFGNWRGVRGSPWARHLLPCGRTPASGLITRQDLLIFRSCPSQTTGAGSGTTSFTLSVGSPSLWVYESGHVPTLSSGNLIREEVINLIFKKPGCCKWKSKFIPKIKWGNSCSL